VKSPPVGFVLVLVLVLDFSGIFEDEDENEDENDGVVGDFSHSLGRRRALPDGHSDGPPRSLGGYQGFRVPRVPRQALPKAASPLRG